MRAINPTTVDALPFDFDAFRIQRDKALQEANKLIAEKINAMEVIAWDISRIVEASGLKVNFYPLCNVLNGIQSPSDNDWNQSSNC